MVLQSHLAPGEIFSQNNFHLIEFRAIRRDAPGLLDRGKAA
jgi:hypothetical protein